VHLNGQCIHTMSTKSDVNACTLKVNGQAVRAGQSDLSLQISTDQLDEVAQQTVMWCYGMCVV
jgi:hypothetical protein